jgi:hypothetical protein
MPGFEDAGRSIDRELEKLRQFFEDEVRPTTKKSAIQALRAASRRLAQLAEELETAAAQEQK